jgi:hypothetical protein
MLMTAAFVSHQTTSLKKDNPVVAGNGFALLELFTSEGCSSCPAADDLLARIQKETQNKPVYVLAYHVDYWNRLGWKDIFSKAEYSKRQTDYSNWFNGQQIYTPQVVINGKTECVGSDEPALRKAITGALTTAPLASVTLQAQQNGDKLTVNYQITGGSKTEQLLIAIVQKYAVSKVERGENSGRTLHHAQIVRDLHRINLTQTKKGSSLVKLPQGFNSKDWDVIGFVQNTTNGEILTAERIRFNTSSGTRI